MARTLKGKSKMRKLIVLNSNAKKIHENKKTDSKISKNSDALDPKKIKETYKAALQLKDGAFTAIEKAYSMIKALKREAQDLSDMEWNADFVQDLENLLKARNALKEVG